MTKSTVFAIMFSTVLCVRLCSLARCDEQSFDQPLRALRGIQTERLSEAEKKSKSIELQQAWEALEKGGPRAIKALHRAITEDRQNAKKDDFFALAAAALLWKLGGVTEADEIARIWQSGCQTVNYNYVFGTAIMAARTRDQQVLPMLRALLHEKKGQFGLPQHAMVLAWPQTAEIVW
jgi:hypothetical protein